MVVIDENKSGAVDAGDTLIILTGLSTADGLDAADFSRTLKKSAIFIKNIFLNFKVKCDPTITTLCNQNLHKS